jgi:hypothetical protein
VSVSHDETSPLSPDQLQVLKETEKYRRPIRDAASLYRLLFALQLVGMVAILIIMGIAQSNAGRNDRVNGLPMATKIIICGATVFWFFAYRSTLKCQRWAPLTVGVITGLSAFASLFLGLYNGLYNSPGPDGAFVFQVGLIAAVVPLLVSIVSFRALANIQSFRNCPVWCQDTLIECGL